MGALPTSVRGESTVNLLSLVNALPGAGAQGLNWGIIAIGAFIP